MYTVRNSFGYLAYEYMPDYPKTVIGIYFIFAEAKLGLKHARTDFSQRENTRSTRGESWFIVQRA